MGLDEEELARLLLVLKKRAPEIYRHLLGTIKAIIAQTKPTT
jgi:hypothetical protein